MHTTYPVDFWRDLLQDYEDLHIERHQAKIIDTENYFTGGFDLDIDLEAGICTDADDTSYSLIEYIATREGFDRDKAKLHIDVEYERWRGKQQLDQQRLQFERDPDNYRWIHKESGKVVTDFDIILESVIEKWNNDKQEWERTYVGELSYLKRGKPLRKPFKFEPAETHSVSEFSSAVWEKDTLIVKNMRNDDMRLFWYCLDYYYEPRIIREFDHYGFIEFEEESFFLTENVLVRFPDNKEGQLKLIAQENGAFPVGKNKYIMPPQNCDRIARLSVGLKNSKTGMYSNAMRSLMDEQQFEKELQTITERFCSMIGGTHLQREWGKLIIGYVFSTVFLQDIYNHFNHVIFLYFYGQGNVGKGEAIKRILDFWGVDYLESLNNPTGRSVDQSLQVKRHIPQWIDEFIPEIPGKKANINDQTWNSWFELKQRPTNIQSGNKWVQERKQVRTMPLFSSNFKPKSDHLISRCLILEYKKNMRGDEKHVKWLMQERERLQMVYLSFLKHYKIIDRDTYIWDVDRLRNYIKQTVKEIIKERQVEAIVHDRQVNQFAALITSYRWTDTTYRQKIAGLRQNIEAEISVDESLTDYQLQNNRKLENKLTEDNLFDFVINHIVTHAINQAQQDPFTDYIETLGTLIQAGEIYEAHYNWTEKGHLKIWAKAVWDKYVMAKRGTDEMVRRDYIRERFLDISETSKTGELLTVNWHNQNTNTDIRQKGYYIKNAYKITVLADAFRWEDHKPAKFDTGQQEPNITNVKQSEFGADSLF